MQINGIIKARCNLAFPGKLIFSYEIWLHNICCDIFKKINFMIKNSLEDFFCKTQLLKPWINLGYSIDRSWIQFPFTYSQYSLF